MEHSTAESPAEGVYRGQIGHGEGHHRAVPAPASPKDRGRWGRDPTGRAGRRTPLPVLPRSGGKQWASPALLNGKTFATTGANLPAARSVSSGAVILCISPSRRPQLRRWRLNTPR